MGPVKQADKVQEMVNFYLTKASEEESVESFPRIIYEYHTSSFDKTSSHIVHPDQSAIKELQSNMKTKVPQNESSQM